MRNQILQSNLTPSQFYTILLLLLSYVLLICLPIFNLSDVSLFIDLNLFLSLIPLVKLEDKGITNNQLSIKDVEEAVKKLNYLATNFLLKNNIKLPIFTNSHSMFRQTRFMLFNYLPTIYPNITLREINGISRIIIAWINDGTINFDTLHILLSDPNIELILKNALINENIETSPITLDFSNSILIHYSPLAIAYQLFLNPLSEKQNMTASLKNKSGVYCWYNKKSGNLYVGSSKNLSIRLSTYLGSQYLNSAKTSQLPLSNGFKNQGYNNYMFIILEFCDINVLISTEQK